MQEIERVDMVDEEWRDIPNFEMYQISNYGRVFTKYKNKLLSICDNGNGYKVVNLHKNKTQKMHSIHRLVASAFIPNPNNLPEVNHILGIKSKNSIYDIEWITKEGNTKHKVKNNLTSRYWTGVFGEKHHNSIRIDQFTKDGLFVADYACAKEAERQTGISQPNISSCCTGNLKSAGGFVWKHSLINSKTI